MIPLASSINYDAVPPPSVDPWIAIPALLIGAVAGLVIRRFLRKTTGF